MNESELILASGSPRRKELLEKAGVDFIVMPSDAEEDAPLTLSSADVAMHNARLKAEAIANHVSKEKIVIGADTIVVLDGTIFGKPADASEAHEMLGKLSNKTHEVITGVCIFHKHECKCFAEVTKVTFKDLSPEIINGYIETGEPLDKAGAYGIQGKGGSLVDHIDGDFDNVVGLPVKRLLEELELTRPFNLERCNEISDG